MMTTATIVQRIAAVTIFTVVIAGISAAAVSVKVFSMDEALAESNMSKPRIYIQNTGTETLDDFYYRYYFETEGGKPPMMVEYYNPNSTVMVVPCGSGYYLQYNVTDANLTPGGLLPHSSGNCVGLSFNDWSAWDKTNDFSNNLGASFQENPNIAVFYNNARIYGSEPGGVAGSVLREVWTGISGISTDNIPLNTAPQVTGYQSTLDAPKYTADNYGARIRGYITAPGTGDYTFYIASDNGSKLFLSTDTDTANKALIASVTGWTGYMSWYDYSSQASAPLVLVAGNKYYIEILHKEGDQGDHCSVGWLTPGQSGSPVIVPGTVLTPYVPAILPGVPSLTATAVSSNRIDLSWSNVANELGYRIEKATGLGDFSPLVTLTANQTSYQVTGLGPESSYRFRIKSYNNTGESDFSAIVQATTSAVIEGKATREIWTGISGTRMSDIPLSNPANIVEDIYQLETPQQYSEYYGQRIRGYIIPPATGNYVFWIASDDNSQLLLSTNDYPANKQMIAEVQGYCSYHQWSKYTSQKSAVKTLTAGVRYYFEVLHKEGNQNDNLSVGWARPGQAASSPSEVIPGSVLSPYVPPTLPNAPDGLTATAISATQMDLSWSDNSNNELGFRIERAQGSAAFELVYTSVANATVYHDGGLSANTQYRYRIMAYNGLGNSGYSAIVTGVTPAQSSTPPPADPALNGFGLYSSVKTELRDNCAFNGGGAIGSNALVELLPLSIINGSVVSGGDILLRPQAEVMENATAAGTVTLEPSSAVHGDIIEGAMVSVIEIPEKTSIPTGTQDIIVQLDQNYGTLSPGRYKKLEVKDRGSITFVTGHYTFTELFLSTRTKIELDLDMGESVEIDVEGDLEFSDNSQVVFKDEGYVPFVRFYTNDRTMVRIGCDVRLNGMVTAPHGDVHIYSRARCNGAIYAKTITIEPEAVINSDAVVNQCADNDGDRIQNIIEVIMNTDPEDPEDYIPIAIPSTSCIDNTREVTITYDFSIYFPDYDFATEVKATFPAGALTRSYIPLLIYVSNLPSSGAAFDSTAYRINGRYLNFRSENGLNPGMSFTLELPRAGSLSALEAKWFQTDGTRWQLLLTSDAGSSSGGVQADLDNTGPVAGADEVKNANYVIYYDEECVFTRNLQTQLQYYLNVTGAAGTVDGITVTVNHSDPATGTAATPAVIDLAPVSVGSGKSFFKEGKLWFTDPVRIDSCIITIKESGQPDVVYTEAGGNSFKIEDGKAMQMLLATTAGNIKKGGDQVEIALFHTDQIAFESASFGDGRITTNRINSAPFAYDYFMKDHLGSTRMVINDQGDVIEAKMYQPYGTMSDVPGATTAAVDVREKFTGKEFDEDGANAVNGVGGLKLFYFGARYYDPDIGLWTSTDPAEQFWSPYSYTGNDYNPINGIDADGNGMSGVGQVVKIANRMPRNWRWAGRIHPSGVPFKITGFPDFSKWAKVTVKVTNLTGKYDVDEALSNAAAKLKGTPDGYVWHHVEDGTTMQLIPKDIHAAAPHTGGAAILRGFVGGVLSFLGRLDPMYYVHRFGQVRQHGDIVDIKFADGCEIWTFEDGTTVSSDYMSGGSTYSPGEI